MERRQQRKGHGLFRLAIEVDVRERTHHARSQRLRDRSGERGVPRPATGQQHVADRFRDESRVRVRDAARGKRHRRRHDVFGGRGGRGGAAPLDEPRDVPGIEQNSRPVDLGGGAAKYGSASKRRPPRRRSPALGRASCPSTSNGSAGRRARRTTASMTTTPGPVSKARTAGAAAAGRRRRSSRCRCRRGSAVRATRSAAQRAATSAIDTSGAPCPPAATSRTRKSLTTSRPVRSAITADSPICHVDRPGSCHTVCPCDPIARDGAARDTTLGQHRDRRVRQPVPMSNPSWHHSAVVAPS